MRSRRLICFLLILLLCAARGFHPSRAHAEECFTINVDTLDMNSLRDRDYVAAHLSARVQGIRVQKYISSSSELAARVRLILQQMDTGTVIFDKNYNYQSGTFDSGEIYLPYAGNDTVPYLVTLYVEDWVYAMPFMRLQPRFTENGACGYGVRMRDLNPDLTTDWLMGTMLDLTALRDRGGVTVPLCASNAYVVGQADVALAGEQLFVSLSFAEQANVEVQQCAIYVVRNVSELTTADPARMRLPAYRPGEGADVSGADTVLLYIPMLISYDPSGLRPFDYSLAGDGELQRQLALWNLSLAGGAERQPEPPPEWQEPTPAPTDTEWEPWLQEPEDGMEEEAFFEPLD